MYYVGIFDPDPTKSFTNAAYNNILALQSKKVNFELRPLNHVLNWGDAPHWFGNARDYFARTRPPSTPTALVHLQISDLLKVPYRSPTDAIGLTAFEATMVPRWICEGLNVSYRGLIVPSEYCKSVLLRCGVTIPVRVVPHALPSMWLKDALPIPAKPSDTYIFGSCGYWNARKNTDCLLEAYIKAFPEPNNTALLLKTYNAGHLESKIRELAAGSPRSDIWVYDAQWDEQQMLWAFSMMDCYVSPTRGEAFGLSLAQAAAMGLPCVYTNHSAPTEWLKEEGGHYPLEYTLCKVSETMTSKDHPFEHIKGPSIEWAEVKRDNLVETLKHLAETKPRRGFSEARLSEFRRELSWSVVGEKLTHSIEDILDRELERVI